MKGIYQKTLLFDNIVNIMKLMKKITIIFISASIVSVLLYCVLGKIIIETTSSSELENGASKTNDIVKKIEGEIDRVIFQDGIVEEYIGIISKVNNNYGEEKLKQIMNIKDKVDESSIQNMIIINNDFKINEVVKNTNLDIESSDIESVLDQSREIIKDNKSFSGVISTENLCYIVSVNRIDEIGAYNNKYSVIINPINDSFIGSVFSEQSELVEIVKYNDDISKLKSYDRDFLYEINETSMDIFEEFEILGDGPNYYLRFEYDMKISGSIINNTIIFIAVLIIISIGVNILLYRFVKVKAVDRIKNINSVVNKVTGGANLEITLDDDINSDEISGLTKDLNRMFRSFKNYADNLEYIESHDLLTSLINRSKLTEYIGELKNNSEEFALFFIDLDNFKIINDTLGHNVGDQLLCQVAKELTECTDDKNTSVSRIGGDEFIIIRKGENDNDEIEKLAQVILDKLGSIYGISNYSYEIKASMGISFYPQHSEKEIDLLQYSDIAMYHSKRTGGNSYNIFNDKMLEPLEIEKKLKNGIKNKEFEAYYQPIYSIKENRIIGAEALVRWKTATGIIYPDKFIPVAKKTGNIVDIDMLVLRQSINLCREQIDNGVEDFYVSINASKRFLKQSNFIDIIQKELENQNVPTSSLRLEITEDEIIDEVEYTKELLKEIRKIGIKVYLDDFGTGYSSFNHIKTLPIDVVKIDRSFIIDIEDDKISKSIVETMINLCHNLNLKVVCEGVEVGEQVEILRQINCDDIQGYYFSKPLQKEMFDIFLKEF